MLPFFGSYFPYLNFFFCVCVWQKSSSADTETEFFSGNDNDNTSNMSPFNMTGGFDDGASPSPSELENMEDEDGAVSWVFSCSGGNSTYNTRLSGLHQMDSMLSY